jgi:choline dehydrogenase-like flavoprotein
MFEDFRDLEDGIEIAADVCIIGAGPAGIACAREFVGTTLRVVVLESGGLRHDGGTHSLCESVNVGDRHRGALDGRRRVFGGTSDIWAAACVELDESDFAPRPWAGVTGWPIRKADLGPYYDRARGFFGIAGATCDDDVWRSFGMEAPRLRTGSVDSQYFIQPSVTHVGDLHRESFMAAENILTLLHATVTSLHPHADGSRISHARIATLEGKTGTVRARVFVICCGGIDSARLLLLSRERHPEGIGNAHGNVGRYFQDHAEAVTAEILPSDLGLFRRTFNRVFRSDATYGVRLSLARDAQRRAEVVNCRAEIVYDHGEESAVAATRRLVWRMKGRLPRGEALGDLRILVCNPHELVQMSLERYVARRFPVYGARIRLKCVAEQPPHRENRIALAEERDQLGQPKACIDWRVGDAELRAMRVMTRAVTAELERAGVAKLLWESWLSESAREAPIADTYHHMGTTRMSLDPRDGVVDPRCRVHEMQGLYIASSSVFPASGHANPTLTIVALALRVADDVKAELGLYTRAGSITVDEILPSPVGAGGSCFPRRPLKRSSSEAMKT